MEVVNAFTNLLLQLKYYLTQYVLTHFSLVWYILGNIPIVRDIVDRFVINAVAQSLQFPLPYSTLSPYTSLSSFTDHTYFNRILPAKEPSKDQGFVLPDVKQVCNELFVRPSTGGPLDNYTNFLFLSFAQWFVDQFLMTDPDDSIKQYSQNVINLSTVYGDTPAAEQCLRAFTGGRLKSQTINGEEFPQYLNDKTRKILVTQALERLIKTAPPNTVDWKKLFAIGHVRMNITPGCLTFAIIFFREHNRVAHMLQTKYDTWDDERVFQTAKIICIVEVMKIAVEDYVINHIAYKLKYPLKFRPEVLFHTDWYYNNQRIFIEFNHLYRWHSFVPSTLTIDNKQFNLVNDSTTDQNEPQLLWNTDVVINTTNTLSGLISNLSKAPAGKFGLLNTHPLLVERVEAMTIESGRKAKLASFNDYREKFGLWRLYSIDEITANPVIRERLKRLYANNVDNVEFYVGLMAEDQGVGNSIFPPLLATIVGAEAFRGVFGNPLLSPSVYNATTFTPEGLKVIEGTTLKSIVTRNVPKGTIRREHLITFDLPPESVVKRTRQEAGRSLPN